MFNLLNLDPDEMADLRAEFAPRRRRALACHDRMCGADDCPNCHPEGPNDENLLPSADEDSA